MNNSLPVRKEFRCLIEELLEQRIDCDSGLARVIELGKRYAAARLQDKTMNKAFEAIIHFCSDEDIRALSGDYAAKQIDELKSLYTTLSIERLEEP